MVNSQVYCIFKQYCRLVLVDIGHKNDFKVLKLIKINRAQIVKVSCYIADRPYT
jgi:hypothetical protein